MMRPTPTSLASAALRLGRCLLVSSPLAAAEPDLLGRWWWNVFETPAEVRFSGGQLVGGNDFGVFVGAEEFLPTPNGTRFQNLTDGEEEERGRATVSDSLVVRQEFDLGGENRLHLNKALDVMIGAGVLGDAGPDFASLEILLRQPTAPFTIADLAGQWDYGYIEVPGSVSAPNLTPGATLSGAIFSVETDRFTVTPGGLVTITESGEPLGDLRWMQGLPTFVGGGVQVGFHINRGLDVMLSVKADQTDEDVPEPIYNFSMLLRRPETVTVADVVGRWHVSELYTPTRLRVGAGPTVQGGSDFGAETFTATFFPDGRLGDADGEVNSWSLTPDGLVQIGGPTSGVRFALNRSKTFAATVTSGGDNTLSLAVKHSDDPGIIQPPTLELVREPGGWRLVWTGGILESAPTPAGPWTPVPGASRRSFTSFQSAAWRRASSTRPSTSDLLRMPRT